MSRAARGSLVVLSGPSGVGKTAVAERLLHEPGFARAVTATTRAPRPGEREGVDYLFRTEAEFRADIAAGRFLEHAQVHGRLYGTPRSSVDAIQSRGDVCLLVIDVQGAATLRTAGVPALYVFLAPPSREELERRLRGRATDSDDQVRARLATALVELDRRDEFDACVVNDDLERAVSEIRLLASARRP